jgi:hypothetical protein
MRRFPAFWLIAFTFATGCGESTGPDTSDVLAVRVRGADLVFTNRTSRELATFVIAADILPLANIVFCPEPMLCEGRPPGATWRQSIANVYGLEPGREVVILWKELAVGDAGRRHLVRSGHTSVRP